MVLAVLLVSCAGPTGPTEPPIRDVLWRARSIQQGTRLTVVPEPDRYTIRFDDRVGLVADCNVCGGSYTLTGTRIVVRDLVCTLAFCGERSLDRDFLRLVEAAETARVVDGELVLASPEGVLRFRP
jgi:heat shock protein HslJ